MRHHATVPVWDHKRCVGAIAECAGCRYEAIKPNGFSMGLYNSPTAAATALVIASRESEVCYGR